MLYFTWQTSNPVRIPVLQDPLLKNILWKGEAFSFFYAELGKKVTVALLMSHHLAYRNEGI